MPTTELVRTENGLEQLPFKGIGLPTRINPYPKIKLERDLIFDSVITILLTKKGQRLFAPTFGSDLWKILFQPADHTTTLMAEQYIWEALRFWEPRIQVTDVRAAFRDNSIIVYIKYAIITVGEEMAMQLQISTDTFVLLEAARS